MLDLLFFLATAFGDSDDGDDGLNGDLLDNQDELEGSGSLDAPAPPIRVADPLPRPPPFDMVDFMHKSASYDLQKVFSTAADDDVHPRHVPSERPGGEARREILKSRAANISRSVSEIFAYATSRTISGEDTAVVLETFGNVR